MALSFSTLGKPVSNQVVDPATGKMREEWALYFDQLTKRLNGAVGELEVDDAPADAQYIVGAASSGLSAERVATNSTSNTWNLATPGQAAVERAALTGDVTASANSNATTIANDAVTNPKLANMAQATIKGRAVGAGTGDPTDLTATQATAILDAFTSALKGLVPASGGGTTTFLRADATFAAPTRIVNAVAQGTVSAAATLDISLGSADMYEIDLINLLPATDAQELWARFSQSGSFLAGAADYSWGRATSAGGAADESDSEITLTDGVENTADSSTGCNITVRVFRPSAAAFAKGVNWFGGFKSSTGPTTRATTGQGKLIANTNAIDGIRFLFASGNIASGYYAVRSYSFT